MYTGREKWNIWIVYAVAMIVTIYMLSYIVLTPGSVLLSTTGDAGKNYFTYLYHSLYGNGMHFDGMNYPYGEHIIFTDGQPLLSVLQGYSRNIIPIDPLSIMHLLIGLSSIIICITIDIHITFANSSVFL